MIDSCDKPSRSEIDGNDAVKLGRRDTSARNSCNSSSTRFNAEKEANEIERRFAEVRNSKSTQQILMQSTKAGGRILHNTKGEFNTPTQKQSHAMETVSGGYFPSSIYTNPYGKRSLKLSV